MNLFIIIVLHISILSQICSGEDYGTQTYDPDSAKPTNDYLNTNDPKYDNPYDPNRRFQNRNQYDKPYSDKRYNQYERNDLNPYNPENTPRPTWDSSRTYSTSYKGAELEHESVIINEA